MRRWAGVCLLAVCARGDLAGQSFDPIPSSAQVTVEMVELAADRMLADEAYPPLALPAGPLPRDLQILVNAESSPFANVRRAFLRVLGRFESSGDVERIVPHLGEADWTVRRQAAESIGQALVRTKPGEAPKVVQLAFDVLRIRLLQENNVEVLAAVLATLGDLPYESPLATQAERLLVAATHPAFPRPGAAVAVAALDALESFISRLPRPSVEAATRKRLRELAVHKESPMDLQGPFVSALQALLTLQDTDVATITAAARYRCSGPSGPECGWEIRRAATQMMTGSLEFDPPLTYLLRDASFHVRMAALHVIAAAIPKTQDCGSLIAGLSDPAPQVVMTAIDLVVPPCSQRDEITSRLTTSASELSGSPAQWQVPARAFVALARFDPSAARHIANEIAAVHGIWQVRADAANVSAVVGDEALALRLSDDAEPNVRTEALRALFRLKSPSLTRAAVKALKSDDFQLILTAAAVLKGAPDREAVVPALIEALQRITGPDTSREARLEIWARLVEGPSPDPDQLQVLIAFARDYDPLVAAVAAPAVSAWTGSSVPPNPTRRPPSQPTEAELQIPWVYARVELEDGTRFLMELDHENAPIAVARFVKLAYAHFYDGTPFYRVVTEFQATAGSPGANDYMGAPRFARDEIGAHHSPGAVSLATRGWLAADMRWNIDLIHLPRLNRQTTVFARVTAGERPHCLVDPMKILDGIDRSLDGVKIASVTLPVAQARPLACY